MKKILILLIFWEGAFGVLAQKTDAESDKLRPVPYPQLTTGGELRTRILRNFDRLEETKYQPAHVFLTNKQSGNWPGDTEGRTILGLVMNARASGREPQYLKEIIDLIPQKLNTRGYMGDIHPEGIMDEQQLSGNGWMLRAMCEYYTLEKDKKALNIIKSIVDNLFIPGKGYYNNYPIDPKDRIKDVGEAMGTIVTKSGNWMLSTDIGCLFIGMDGAIHAYQYVPTSDLKSVIDEMVARFLQIDLVSIKAQTHATLTAMRGLLRYAEITGNKGLVSEVAKRWELYKSFGMTENFANYNWFTRYEASTEPCAIVDSYMVAAQLWMLTQDSQYLPYLDLIYYNALAHGQRENGGFGCDKYIGGNASSIVVSIPEAHWCCTMRGGEGLSKVAEYSYFTGEKSLYVVHYNESKVVAKFSKSSFISLEQKTDYPFSGEISLKIIGVGEADNKVIRLNDLRSFVGNVKVLINGKEVSYERENGFIVLRHKWRLNDSIRLTFDQKMRLEKSQNKIVYNPNSVKILYGPLLLGYSQEEPLKITDASQVKKVSRTLFSVSGSNATLTPVYHLMSKDVIKGETYKKQIIF